MKIIFAEYIWLDGAVPTQKLRSKTRILNFMESPQLEDFPDWGFDGSSTNQATRNCSDCDLKPVFFTFDPIRGPNHYVVMCEVFDIDGQPHKTNHRAAISSIMDKGGKDFDAYLGFEQEYTFLQGRDPLGWPKHGIPGIQGPFYCGLGSENVFGREIVEKHTHVCAEANLLIYGTNSEVMPGQWEFQVGYRDFKGEKADPLTVSDHAWVARYFLQRVAEQHHVTVSFDNKPLRGDWNGAGMHTNFSTHQMRDKKTGKKAIEKALEMLREKHHYHIQGYGHGLQERLTGFHETSSIHEFKAGVSDRGASIRIPPATSKNGYGYIEDRRPGANCDPYKVSTLLMETICGVSP